MFKAFTDEEDNKTPNETENIKEFGTTLSDGPIRIISIIGQIEGHSFVPPQSKATKYEHIIPLLTTAEQSDKIKGVLILMNTVGGDVEAGLAIAELIRGMSKPTVSLVLGGGHSIGVPLAVSADHSFIASSAAMTVHPVRTTGLFITVEQNYEYYEKMQQRVLRFICECSDIEEDTLKKLMLNTRQLADDTGTVLIGEEAVECGLIDSVGGLSDALNMLNTLIS